MDGLQGGEEHRFWSRKALPPWRPFSPLLSSPPLPPPSAGGGSQRVQNQFWSRYDLSWRLPPPPSHPRGGWGVLASSKWILESLLLPCSHAKGFLPGPAISGSKIDFRAAMNSLEF